MALHLSIGLDAIGSYRRLSYTPWHALAEFVDNSTQSYFDHKDELDEIFAPEGAKLEVSINYSSFGTGYLRIADNAMGMSYTEIRNAFHVAKRPADTSGRSKYGLGLKTAACWIGNHWTLRTKKLGETFEHNVTVNVEKLIEGKGTLDYQKKLNVPKHEHYTIIEITQHNRKFKGPTLGKIRTFLSSMYRQDLRKKLLILRWQDEILHWKDLDDQLLKDPLGKRYKRDFDFNIIDVGDDGEAISTKRVHGWIGILDRGSRARAGFSIMHSDRVIRGWPDSWRPTTLYGQDLGSNDLVNQRLVGEIHLDDFEVSHTKDNILWLGDQEELVEGGLLAVAEDYKRIANTYRKNQQDARGPSPAEISVAVDELKRELESAEMHDAVALAIIPPHNVIVEALSAIAEPVLAESPTYHTTIDTLQVAIYLEASLSPNDPYVINDSAKLEDINVVVNKSHPHWKQLQASRGVLNYLRHCVYDAIAEWQAGKRASRLDPDTIKILKDRLLRVPFEMEAHGVATSIVEE